MILVDTSVWIDYFKDRPTVQTHFLSKSVQQNEDVAFSGIVLTEVLQGISDEKTYKSVKNVFQSLLFLPMSFDAYVLAATIYRDARSRGETIRNTTDCLIAACAITHKASLLQNDKDYLVISKVSTLELTAI